MGDNLPFLLNNVLKKENYAVNFDELKLQLLSHPSYPSLHAFTGVLDHFDIDNLALEVPKDLETLKQLPIHFLSFINEKSFVVVKRLENGVELLRDNQKKEKYTIEDFLSIWSGVILVVEKEVNEPSEININHKMPATILRILSGVCIIGLFFFLKPSVFESVYFILSLIGIGISILILKHELGVQSKAVEKFCTATASSSCDDVLNSKGASFFGALKLSDLSIIYFSTLVASSLLAMLLSISYDALITISLLAVPITLYSIYYQYNIVKKWCPLCLTVVAVLWAQACCKFLSSTPLTSIKFDISSNFILFFSLIFISAIWLFLKPLIKKQQEFQKLEIAHYKFKRNIDLFKGALHAGEYVNTNIDQNNEIVLGNKNAPINMLLVTSPSCYYCRGAHTDLEKVVSKNPNEVSITIRFSVTDDTSHVANKVAQRLLEIYNEGNETEIRDSLHNAYKDGVDLQKWLSIYGASRTSFTDVLKAQQKWCYENSINFTPAVFLNGKPFPRVYDRSDLSYFIEDLAEQIEVNQPALNIETVG